ncbi:MAG: anthranilate phosphoribosyltransferase [Pseudomonadota bacterium]|nr:anthranilate phosphoribosyltransferase [Pseudomonadota bacterium]MEC9076924.1 anthranilate phosphoribosyltransferase [Pseudomonadota bacterium]
MTIQEAIATVCAKHDLHSEDMIAVMRSIMTGEATDAQIGALLMGLRMKGETIDEIVGAASVMRELSQKVDVSNEFLVDTCGTGGDGANIFNVSTASAFVVAAAGGRVAKHGNRSVSSQSGSADVLEAAGVRLDLDADQVKTCIETLGVGFMFAPAHHSAMRYTIGPRKELAMRTIFNVLGPLTNPAGAPNQVLGVFDEMLLTPLAEVLHRLGSRHVLVVRSEDGLDELSVSAASRVAELKDGRIREYRIKPQDFELELSDRDELIVETAEQSLELIKMALVADDHPASDIVALNAGAAIYTAGCAHSFEDGVEAAWEVIESGEAMQKFEALARLTQELKGE